MKWKWNQNEMEKQSKQVKLEWNEHETKMKPKRNQKRKAKYLFKLTCWISILFRQAKGFLLEHSDLQNIVWGCLFSPFSNMRATQGDPGLPTYQGSQVVTHSGGQHDLVTGRSLVE